MKQLSSVLLLGDRHDPRVRVEEKVLGKWLAGRGVRVLRGRVRKDMPEVSRADLVVALGGDGTFLRAAQSIGRRTVPMIGIRFGTFGYLAELERGAWEKAFTRLLAGDGRIETWQRLHCRVKSPRGVTRDLGLALNEVMVTAAMVARMVEVNLRIDGEDVTGYRGDGIIVATPVGSTAHSLAAGGPIVDRTDRCLLVTPLASHALTYRPLVLEPHRSIQLTVLKARQGTAVTVDGQQAVELPVGAVIEIRDSGNDLHVASAVDRTRFRTLRERLQWGAPLVETTAPGTLAPR